MKKILSFMSLTLLVAGCADRTMPVADLPEIDTSNPLLAEWETPYATPPFERIELKDYEPAFDAAIAVQRAEIEAIVKNPAKPSFHNTIVALERSGELLSRIEGLFYNLLEADSNDEMQRIALDVQPKLTALLALLQGLEDYDMLADTASIALGDTHVELRYLDRFTVKLSLVGDMDYKLQALKAAVPEAEKKLGEQTTGTFDLTQESITAVYTPD